MEYATHHLYFPYTHEPLGEFVYEENTSDKVGSNQETNIDNIFPPGGIWLVLLPFICICFCHFLGTILDIYIYK